MLTVINGPHTGAKAFFAEDGLLWQHPENGFFTEQGEAAEKIRTSGQQELAGETVFCDCLGDKKKLVICGAGHVGVALLRMALRRCAQAHEQGSVTVAQKPTQQIASAE